MDETWSNEQAEEPPDDRGRGGVGTVYERCLVDGQHEPVTASEDDTAHRALHPWWWDTSSER